MRLDLSLRDLAAPRLIEELLLRPSRTLQEITSRNEARWVQGNTSKAFQNRKDRLRTRLQAAVRNGEQFLEVARTEVGWQRLLLGIYLDDLGEEWLPAFDRSVAIDVLGRADEPWHASRRRQVTQFFFHHFDVIEALSFVCERLRQSYAVKDGELNASARLWAEYRALIFDPHGPSKVASKARAGETVEGLRERFGVPTEGRFTESLRQHYLLESLNQCRLGDEPPTLGQIESAKAATALQSMRIGAAALRIMVRRVAKEARGRWPDGWQKWIVRLGCDPRLGRASAEGAKWWGWATDAELRLAQQGVTGLTLRFFIQFLELSLRGTPWESQFALRSRFLIALFDANKIIDARLSLNQASLQRLEPRYRDSWSVAHLSAANDGTSMIALRCTEDLFILEGTHNYGLRAFHRTFPVPGFWERTRRAYQDNELRISPRQCPVFVPHVANGNWILTFFHALREKFHVEWGDVRI
jgi:hypothetical protein